MDEGNRLSKEVLNSFIILPSILFSVEKQNDKAITLPTGIGMVVVLSVWHK